MKRNFALIAPYAAWMVLMAVLPQAAWAYAARGAVTAVLLAVGAFLSRGGGNASAPVLTASRGGGNASAPVLTASRGGRNASAPVTFAPPQWGGGILAAAVVGLVVFAVWIAPEPWLWPSSSTSTSDLNLSSPYAPAVCGWSLTLAKLCASAFVISVAEELFFRKWLVEFAGFGWMLVLFGVEHMRWDLGTGRGCVFIAEGVFAGLAYGLLAKRFGIVSAIVAHAVTNLVLGLYVIGWDKWFYW